MSGVGLGDDFAVEFEHQPQHAVRGRMRRPHVEHHFFANVVLGMAQLRIGCDDSRHRIG